MFETRLVKLKACPRCSGDMVEDTDIYGFYELCLQCGFIRDTDADVVNKRKQLNYLRELSANTRYERELVMLGTCIFSDDRQYRYLLTRYINDVEEQKTVLFICLNPSKADEYRDDLTVKKCQKWAKTWGFNRLLLANIFAYKATDPQILYGLEKDPISQPKNPLENNFQLARAIEYADRIVVAWGVHGAHLDRGLEVLQLISRIGKTAYCFGLTIGGYPKHPSRLAYATPLHRVVVDDEQKLQLI